MLLNAAVGELSDASTQFLQQKQMLNSENPPIIQYFITRDMQLVIIKILKSVKYVHVAIHYHKISWVHYQSY